MALTIPLKFANLTWSLQPAGALGMLFLATMALIAPESEPGRQFLNTAGSLFEIEMVFMHSAIFFQFRNSFEDSKPKYWGMTLFIILVYGLFVDKFVRENNDPLIWVNYFMLVWGRIVQPKAQKVPEILQTKIGLDLPTYQKLSWVLSLLKAGAFLCLIPLLMFLPFPNFALDEEIIQRVVHVPNNPRDLIVLIKVFWIFYFVQSAFNLRRTYLRFSLTTDPSTGLK